MLPHGGRGVGIFPPPPSPSPAPRFLQMTPMSAAAARTAELQEGSGGAGREQGGDTKRLLSPLGRSLSPALITDADAPLLLRKARAAAQAAAKQQAAAVQLAAEKASAAAAAARATQDAALRGGAKRMLSAANTAGSGASGKRRSAAEAEEVAKRLHGKDTASGAAKRRGASPGKASPGHSGDEATEHQKTLGAEKEQALVARLAHKDVEKRRQRQSDSPSKLQQRNQRETHATAVNSQAVAERVHNNDTPSGAAKAQAARERLAVAAAKRRASKEGEEDGGELLPVTAPAANMNDGPGSGGGGTRIAGGRMRSPVSRPTRGSNGGETPVKATPTRGGNSGSSGSGESSSNLRLEPASVRRQGRPELSSATTRQLRVENPQNQRALQQCVAPSSAVGPSSSCSSSSDVAMVLPLDGHVLDDDVDGDTHDVSGFAVCCSRAHCVWATYYATATLITT